MNDYEKVKKCLEIIKKNGDLYDTIALKEDVMADTVHPKWLFAKANILLFSRILYGGVLIANKVRSLFSPIQKVKEAQEQIRDILGVNIDIIKPKTFTRLTEDREFSQLFFANTHLAILYEDNDATVEEYTESLKKILQFSSLHGIEEILLRESDIEALFPGVTLEEFMATTMKRVLNYKTETGVHHSLEEDGYDIESEISTSLLSLNINDLQKLIRQLEIIKIDKKKILSLSENIQDIVIKKATEQFLKNGNLNLFRTIVNQRLMYIINENNSYKDKANGKIFQQVEIKGQLIKVVSINSDGQVVGNVITTLYDYLGVLNYRNLLKRANLKNDQQELFRIAALDLYLCSYLKKGFIKRKTENSFYDYIFRKYEEKKEKKIKKIPGLYTKDGKNKVQIINFIIGFVITAALFLLVCGAGYSFDFIQYCLDKEQTTVGDSIYEYMIQPYLRSLEFEVNLVKNAFSKLQTFELELEDIIKNKNLSNDKSSLWGIGDKEEENAEIEDRIASIASLSNEPLPNYFAMKYATGAHYEEGNVIYEKEIEHIYFSEMEPVEPLFSVQYEISKKDLQNAIQNIKNSCFLEKVLYPVGDNYVVTRIIISEKSDPLNKTVEIYIKDGSTWGTYSQGTNAIEALGYIEEPQVCCLYGISEKSQNSFVRGMRKESSYVTHSKEEIRNAIIRGLELDENATDREAFSAIKNKFYSLTPIEDAGMSEEIKQLDEVEFYETVASLDSLICNLAALLATGVDDELICVSGFYVDQDDYVTSSQGHDWTMTKEGEIIDVTPSKEAEKLVTNFLNWGIEKYIPASIIIALAGYFVHKKYGKQIRFKLALKKLEQTMTAENFEVTYAKLKETVYDGIHIPVSRDLSETVSTVDSEFCGWTLEELKELKRELKNSDLTSSELRTSFKLIKEIPFIRKNKDAIQKVLKNRNI